MKYFMFDWSIYRLFVLKRGWKRESLQILLYVYASSSWSIGDLKTRFETWITRNVVNGVRFLHLSYLITVMAYLWSQWTPNVQIKFVMFDWLIYRLFVLNTAWKLDSLQMMKFVNVSWTLRIVQMKTRFETWLTRNDVSLFHLFYLITLMGYLRSQWTPNFKSSILYFTGWYTDYLC
jgi:hypothetical protein